jgi:hypothetical protein
MIADTNVEYLGWVVSRVLAQTEVFLEKLAGGIWGNESTAKTLNILLREYVTVYIY